MATIRRFVAKKNGNELIASEEISSDWSYVSEPIGISSNNAFKKPGLVEQINTTADQSDYLWYSIRYKSTQLFIFFKKLNIIFIIRI